MRLLALILAYLSIGIPAGIYIGRRIARYSLDPPPEPINNPDMVDVVMFDYIVQFDTVPKVKK